MKPSELLSRARALIAPRAAWNKGHFALTASSIPCGTKDSGACSWCATGAISAVAENIDTELKAGELLQSCVPTYNTIIYNDLLSTTHADILEVFDTAIEKAKHLEALDPNGPSPPILS